VLTLARPGAGRDARGLAGGLHARLDRLGAPVKSHVIEADGQDGKLLLEAAAGLGASLFVAGAFGHSRAREFVFGGATRTFLNTTTSPALLLAH
jgi:nucleotide-binding universal stress UspA family protein